MTAGPSRSLPAALEAALRPETAARAGALAPRIRTDGAAVAAGLLFDACSAASAR